MTMRHSLGLLTLSAAFLACSGRYYEVGSNDGAAGTGATGSGAAAGQAPSAIAGTQAVGATGSGGTMSAGEGMPVGEFGPQCVQSGAPPQLAGQFAEPAVIWNRVAMLTWGKPVAPMYGLPETTTYTWAGDVARSALVNAKDTLGSVPGVEVFLRQWLALPATASFQHSWSESLVTTNLILEPEGPARASGNSAVTVFQQTDQFALQPIIGTRNFDRYEEVDGQWRFAYRRIEMDLFGDLSAHMRRPVA